jgi:uncharacterized protein
MAVRNDAAHLPYPAPIDAYGNGGFRFAGMSHRGSLLCLPDGIWAWPVTAPDDIDEAALAPAFERAAVLDMFLIGAGAEVWIMPEPLRQACRAHGLKAEPMQTGPAVRTYNIVLAEGRRVGAALIAVA